MDSQMVLFDLDDLSLNFPQFSSTYIMAQINVTFQNGEELADINGFQIKTADITERRDLDSWTNN